MLEALMDRMVALGDTVAVVGEDENGPNHRISVSGFSGKMRPRILLDHLYAEFNILVGKIGSDLGVNATADANTNDVTDVSRRDLQRRVPRSALRPLSASDVDVEDIVERVSHAVCSESIDSTGVISATSGRQRATVGLQLLNLLEEWEWDANALVDYLTSEQGSDTALYSGPQPFTSRNSSFSSMSSCLECADDTLAACGECGEMSPAVQLFGLTCRHWMCAPCWKRYLLPSISKAALEPRVVVQCPHVSGCRTLVCPALIHHICGEEVTANFFEIRLR